MASQNVVHLTEQNFQDEVIDAKGPVLVDFTAAWCGPCKALSPLIDQVADEYAGDVKVAKLDVDNAPRLAAEYGIRGVPTLMVFNGGAKTAQHVGLTNKSGLVNLIGR